MQLCNYAPDPTQRPPETPSRETQTQAGFVWGSGEGWVGPRGRRCAPARRAHGRRAGGTSKAAPHAPEDDSATVYKPTKGRRMTVSRVCVRHVCQELSNAFSRERVGSGLRPAKSKCGVLVPSPSTPPALPPLWAARAGGGPPACPVAAAGGNQSQQSMMNSTGYARSTKRQTDSCLREKGRQLGSKNQSTASPTPHPLLADWRCCTQPRPDHQTGAKPPPQGERVECWGASLSRAAPPWPAACQGRAARAGRGSYYRYRLTTD